MTDTIGTPSNPAAVANRPALTWMDIAFLIAAYGLPFVDALLANAASNKPVTAEDWLALKAINAKPYEAL